MSELNTFERVKKWNELGCKTAPEPLTDDWRVALINQGERISEEIKEIYVALQNLDRLEVLDGICDVDVTVCGLFYLWGAEMPEEEIDLECGLDFTLHEMGGVTLDIMTRYLQQFINSVQEGDLDEAEGYMVALGVELPYLVECARRNFNYDGAIGAVLDNNDSKYFDDYLEAINHLNLYNADLEDPEYEVCASLDLTPEEMVAETSIAELIQQGRGTFSIHRLTDDKIMKPKGFIGVDLLPFM